MTATGNAISDCRMAEPVKDFETNIALWRGSLLPLEREAVQREQAPSPQLITKL
ncbi:hypothetical protein D3C86_1009330 [compost metagenome]